MKQIRTATILPTFLLLTAAMSSRAQTQLEKQRQSLPYRIVDTGQSKCYDNLHQITPPKPGQPFCGQDAQWQGPLAAHKDNGDGTVTDLNTGLMWIQKPPTDKYSWADAIKVAASLNARNFAGHGDWRLPNIEEPYSIINHDETITDRATGLMWSKEDSKKGLNWQEALAWVQARNSENYLGHNDWRLPNVREMQSIVDYARIPNATNSANVATAIDPLFLCASITDQEGNKDCPYYWTSTSCYNGPNNPDYRFAWYVSFGRTASSVDSGGPGISRARSRLVAEAGAIRYDAKVKGGQGGGPGGSPPGGGPGGAAPIPL